MSDVRTRRISRELFLAAFGGGLRSVEPWVTDRLTAILEEEECASGERIYAEGEPPDHFYMLRQGRIELLRGDGPSEILEAPRALGMVDGLVERPRVESAVAASAVQLLRIHTDSWFGLLEDSFELARSSVVALARAVGTLEERAWARAPLELAPTAAAPDASRAPLDLVERVALLMRAAAFRGAGIQPLSDLAVASEEVRYTRGERLFDRGSSDRIFVIVDGRVEADRVAPHVSWQGGPGQIVCGTLCFAGGASSWEASAVTNTRALAFGIDDWFDVLEENFELVRATLATLALEHEQLRAGRVVTEGDHAH